MFEYWAELAITGVVAGSICAIPWIGGSVVYAVRVQKKCVHPLLLLLTNSDYASASPSSGPVPERYAGVIFKSVSVMMTVAFAFGYHYLVWQDKVWGNWGIGFIKVLLVESSFPLFLLLAWGCEVIMVERHLKRLKPNSR